MIFWTCLYLGLGILFVRLIIFAIPPPKELVQEEKWSNEIEYITILFWPFFVGMFLPDLVYILIVAPLHVFALGKRGRRLFWHLKYKKQKHGN